MVGLSRAMAVEPLLWVVLMHVAFFMAYLCHRLIYLSAIWAHASEFTGGLRRHSIRLSSTKQSDSRQHRRTASGRLCQSNLSKDNAGFDNTKWTDPSSQLLDETTIKETATSLSLQMLRNLTSPL
jgi:nitrate/nitrite-specific signal transduction histidine kinase